MTAIGATWTIKQATTAWEHPARLGSLLHEDRADPPPRHLDAVSKRIAAGLAKGGMRLALFASVRHGKSYLTSWDTPLWALVRYPRWAIGLASYGSEFSALWGRRVRDDIEAHGHNLSLSLRPDQTRADDWMLTSGGSMRCAGVDGPFLGRGFNLLIIDDPVKDPQEAHSTTMRESVWQWYQSARNRLEPHGNMILTMARWDSDDLAGRILDRAAHGGEQWDVIELPAIAGSGDWLGRQPGEPLWPERWPLTSLATTRATLDRWQWASQWQQTPAPDAGAIFDRATFKYYTAQDGIYALGGTQVPVLACERFLVADLALTVKDKSDWTVIGVFDLVPVGGVLHLVLVSLVRGKWMAPDAVGRLRAMYAAEDATGRLKFAGVESHHYGTAVCQELTRAGLRIRELTHSGANAKLEWARAATLMFDQGRVWFPTGHAQQQLELEHELLTFPSDGGHDDQVDVISYACEILRHGAMVSGACKVEALSGQRVRDPYRRPQYTRAGF